MDRTLQYRAQKCHEGYSIARFLKEQGFSEANLTAVRQMPDGILKNGVFVHTTALLTQGDAVTVHLSEKKPSPNIVPVNLPLSIVYEDEDLLVVDKPAGLPTHPSMHNYTHSLANAVAWHYQALGCAFTFRCVSRLDHDTSGLTVIAKHMVSASILSSEIRSRAFRREYLAIVEGAPSPASGTIDAPLGRKPGSIIERTVDFTNGERAVTHYRVIKTSNGLSLVLLSLETGRTHQIRIHMKYLGCPLLGDTLYQADQTEDSFCRGAGQPGKPLCQPAGAGAGEQREEKKGERVTRQALHSFRVRFPHPITREPMEFSSPLPKDLRRAFYGG